MRKLLVALVTGALLATGGSAAFAEDNDYTADPRERSGDNGKCQVVGDPRAGDNDDNGLQRAADIAQNVIREALNDDAENCDNSGGKRPSE